MTGVSPAFCVEVAGVHRNLSDRLLTDQKSGVLSAPDMDGDSKPRLGWRPRTSTRLGVRSSTG